MLLIVTTEWVIAWLSPGPLPSGQGPGDVHLQGNVVAVMLLARPGITELVLVFTVGGEPTATLGHFQRLLRCL